MKINRLSIYLNMRTELPNAPQQRRKRYSYLI